MRIPRIALAIALSLLGAQVQTVLAQDVEQLLAADRFQEAAELISAEAREQADAGAALIFDRAYTSAFQQRRYDDAVDGFRAASAIPGISPRMREQLDFWQGLSVFQGTAPRAEPQNVVSARAALPLFLEAQALLSRAGTYPSTAGVDIEPMMEALATFIEIQEAIIRRGY